MGPRLLRGDYKWVGNGESYAFRGVAERGKDVAERGKDVAERGKKEASPGPEAERTAEPGGKAARGF